jgi:hypothetical protein
MEKWKNGKMEKWKNGKPEFIFIIFQLSNFPSLLK